MRALYLSHTGMTEPLGQSQVLPYLRGLTAAGWQFDVVAFEPHHTPPACIAHTTAALSADGIGYVAIRRSPSHRFAVKVAEAGQAAAQLARLVVARRPRIIHARSHLPGAVAQAITGLAPGTRLLFDCRGLLGDEYVDAGRLTRQSPRYRLIQAAERYLFAHADAIVVLTERMRRWLREDNRRVAPRTPIEVIPCCVDMERFRFRAEARRRQRQALSARAALPLDGRFVLVYSGSLGSWYCEAEMVRFYAALRRRCSALFLVLTRSSTAPLEAAFAVAGLPREELIVHAAQPDDMPAWLAAADAGISFIAPSFSKMASSPTKLAEYLALGLPVVTGRGVGDIDHLIDHEPAAIDAGSLEAAALERAADVLLALDRRSIQAAARQAAARHYSLAAVGIPRYLRLYQQLS